MTQLRSGYPTLASGKAIGVYHTPYSFGGDDAGHVALYCYTHISNDFSEVAMTPKEARALAKLLIEHAERLEGGQ